MFYTITVCSSFQLSQLTLTELLFPSTWFLQPRALTQPSQTVRDIFRQHTPPFTPILPAPRRFLCLSACLSALFWLRARVCALSCATMFFYKQRASFSPLHSSLTFVRLKTWREGENEDEVFWLVADKYTSQPRNLPLICAWLILEQSPILSPVFGLACGRCRRLSCSFQHRGADIHHESQKDCFVQEGNKEVLFGEPCSFSSKPTRPQIKHCGLKDFPVEKIN